LDAKFRVEAENSEVSARTMKSVGDAKSITVDLLSSSSGPVTPASFGASAPLTAQAEQLVRIEVAKLAAFHDAFFERLLEYTAARSCYSDEFVAALAAIQTATYELRTQAVPPQADAIRAFAMSVNLQTLIEGQRQYRARLEAAGKKNPAAMKASLASGSELLRKSSKLPASGPTPRGVAAGRRSAYR
jgi:hypothetical protein